jgi:hypothetical protein
MASWFGLAEMSDFKQEEASTSHLRFRPLLLTIRFTRVQHLSMKDLTDTFFAGAKKYAIKGAYV